MKLAATATAAVCLQLMAPTGAHANAQLSPQAALGRKVFFDQSLSEPSGQACASCHAPDRAFSDPGPGPTSEGAVAGLFGSRNAPSVMYAALTPPLQVGGENGSLSYFGGLFRDGRVNTLQAQAALPFVNPIEMGNPSSDAVVAKVQAAPYAAQFKAVYGPNIFNNSAKAFQAIVDSISAFERSKVFVSFSSKYDAYQRGQAQLTPAEKRGLALFTAAGKGNCASCHVAVSQLTGGLNPLFTDFGFDNIGVPRNPQNKFYSMPAEYNPDGRQFVDIGLADFLPADYTRGQFKAPSLRNVVLTGPYMHNGYFKTLKGVVDFYNTRDVRPTCPDMFTSEAKAQQQGCWPVAEVIENVNKTAMGHLGLSDQEVDDIVTFLGTLTDGWGRQAGNTSQIQAHSARR